MLTILRSIPRTGRVAAVAALIAVGFGASSGPVPQLATSSAMAQSPTLQMLDRFEMGQWEVRARDVAGQRSVLCIDNGRDLIQLRHPGQSCRSFVVEDGPGSVTVQYTCPGNGYGRTHIRYENARLAQVDSQGIASGLPFDFSAEARKIGSCATARR